MTAKKPTIAFQKSQTGSKCSTRYPTSRFLLKIEEDIKGKEGLGWKKGRCRNDVVCWHSVMPLLTYLRRWRRSLHRGVKTQEVRVPCLLARLPSRHKMLLIFLRWSPGARKHLLHAFDGATYREKHHMLLDLQMSTRLTLFRNFLLTASNMRHVTKF